MAQSDLHFERLIWFAVQRTEYIKIQQLKIVIGFRGENLGWEIVVVVRNKWMVLRDI